VIATKYKLYVENDKKFEGYKLGDCKEGFRRIRTYFTVFEGL